MRLRWVVVAVVAISALGGITLGRTDIPGLERFSDYVTDGVIGSVSAAGIRVAPAAPAAIPVSTSLTLQPDGLSALSQPAVDFLATREPQWGVAVALPDRGTVYESNAGESFAMASVTKVVIMATLLSQSEAGQRVLTDADRQLLTTMITESDNDSAVALWDEVGGATAIRAFLEARGIAGITPANASLSWGDSTATPAALVQLLSKLWAGVLLDSTDTTYALHLMKAVVPEQRWGVSAAMPNGGAASALKDGWYDAITGWRVSSVGIDTSTATPVIAVIMTRDQQSMGYAEDTIEGASARIGTAVFKLPAQPDVQPSGALDPTVIHVVDSVDGDSRTVSGSCTAQSTVAPRPDAWTCSTASGVLDPCFQVSPDRTAPLACAAAAGDGFVSLHPTTPLPSISWTADWAHPWKVTLADGVVCVRQPGPQVNDDGDHVTYNCAGGAVLVGPLQRGTVWWALESADQMQTFMDVRVASVTY
jgi:beta-lactamase class A